MRPHQYQPGEWVVYYKTKFRERPSRRAEAIHPAANGDTYAYSIRKYWIVEQIAGDELVLVTRRGNRRRLRADDPGLRPAKWWERWLLRRRFPHLKELEQAEEEKAKSG